MFLSFGWVMVDLIVCLDGYWIGFGYYVVEWDVFDDVDIGEY